MARIIKALTNTEVNNAKAKEKDYKLMDGNPPRRITRIINRS